MSNPFIQYCRDFLRRQGPDSAKRISEKFITALSDAQKRRQLTGDQLIENRKLTNFWKQVFFHIKKWTK